MINLSLLETLLPNYILAPVVAEEYRDELMKREWWKLQNLTELPLTQNQLERIIYLILDKVPLNEFGNLISFSGLVKNEDGPKLLSEIRKGFASYITVPNDEVLNLLTISKRIELAAILAPDLVIKSFLFHERNELDHKTFISILKYIPDEYSLQTILMHYAESKKSDYYDREKTLKNVSIIVSNFWKGKPVESVQSQLLDFFERSKTSLITASLGESFFRLVGDNQLLTNWNYVKNSISKTELTKAESFSVFKAQRESVDTDVEPSTFQESAKIIPIHSVEEIQVNLHQISDSLDNQPEKPTKQEIPIFNLNTETKKISVEKLEPVKSESINEPEVANSNSDDDNVPLFVKLQRAAQQREEEELRNQKSESEKATQVDIFDSVSSPVSEPEEMKQEEIKPDAEVTFDPTVKKQEPKHNFPPLEQLITQSQAKVFVRYLFRKDERRFITVISDLNEISTWEEAKNYIGLVFKEYRVDLYSTEAIQFTDVIYGRYHHL